MRFSKLQKYILLQCFESRNNTCAKAEFYGFYPAAKLKKDKLSIQTSLQDSLDNLVEKDMVTAYGYRTAKKWHIEKIKLTRSGRTIAREILINRQRRLPKI